MTAYFFRMTSRRKIHYYNYVYLSYEFQCNLMLSIWSSHLTRDIFHSIQHISITIVILIVNSSHLRGEKSCDLLAIKSLLYCIIVIKFIHKCGYILWIDIEIKSTMIAYSDCISSCSDSTVYHSISFTLSLNSIAYQSVSKRINIESFVIRQRDTNIAIIFLQITRISFRSFQ